MTQGPQVGLAFALGLATYTVPRDGLVPNPKPPLPEIHEYIEAAGDAQPDPEPVNFPPLWSGPVPPPSIPEHAEWRGGRALHGRPRRGI